MFLITPEALDSPRNDSMYFSIKDGAISFSDMVPKLLLSLMEGIPSPESLPNTYPSSLEKTPLQIFMQLFEISENPNKSIFISEERTLDDPDITLTIIKDNLSDENTLYVPFDLADTGSPKIPLGLLMIHFY